ncbi:GNAT family N-acetyltransferase [Streptomyces ovatisporus]|uniref:GNAT family N-acetyltransferase n=1 Tax=Streptomyces ovatisporus TaxID=1128682 RepID=A0ABV9A3Z6_9ACTN
MDITIRAALDHELEEVGELTARAYLDDGLLDFGEADPYLSVLRAARHRAGHAEVLVAVDGGSGALLGTVTYAGDGGEYAEIAGPREGEFRMLAVRSEGRNRGIGEAMVRACMDKAREGRLERLVLSSHPAMLPAHRLYGRLGFVRTPERDWGPIPGLSLITFALEL